MPEILLDKSSKLSDTREKAINYAREHKIEKSVIMTVAGAANCKMDYNRMLKKGDAKGIVETGYEFGLSENDILARFQKKLNVPLQKAQEYLAMFGKKTV